jgi:hypothetical protein
MTEMNSSIKLHGSVRKQLFNEEGICIYDHTDHNLVVNVGLAYVANWLIAASHSGYFMQYVGLGTSATAPTPSDTALNAEFSGGGYSRQVGTLTSPSSAVWQSVSTFGPGNATGTIQEAGLFSAGTGPTMFAHTLTGSIAKGSSDTFVLTWQVDFSA